MLFRLWIRADCVTLFSRYVENQSECCRQHSEAYHQKSVQNIFSITCVLRLPDNSICPAWFQGCTDILQCPSNSGEIRHLLLLPLTLDWLKGDIIPIFVTYSILWNYWNGKANSLGVFSVHWRHLCSRLKDKHEIIDQNVSSYFLIFYFNLYSKNKRFGRVLFQYFLRELWIHNHMERNATIK